MNVQQRAGPVRAGALLAAIALLLAAAGVALGVWQLERRVWKHSLITAVAERANASPVAAPGSDAWNKTTPQAAAYRRVRATGHFRHDLETPIQAVTEQGGGYWVLTPLETGEFIVLVNRGFVPPDRRDPASRTEGNPGGHVTVTGLLRVSEPGGGFLRSNDPATGRWYSRDVAAIVRAQRIEHAVPYFIDADATPNEGGYPVGGLTVLSFPDNHFVYALTWFALAAGCGWAAWLALSRQEAAV